MHGGRAESDHRSRTVHIVIAVQSARESRFGRFVSDNHRSVPDLSSPYASTPRRALRESCLVWLDPRVFAGAETARAVATMPNEDTARLGRRANFDLGLIDRLAYWPPPFRRSISACPRRMEHHSLWSATGIPHSTQTRTRWVGSAVFDEKRRFRNDIESLQGTWTACSRTKRGAAGLHRSARIRPLTEAFIRSATPPKGWEAVSRRRSARPKVPSRRLRSPPQIRK